MEKNIFKMLREIADFKNASFVRVKKTENVHSLATVL